MAALGGECDFVNEIALYYPLRVIMEILGVPPRDEPRMLKLTPRQMGYALKKYHIEMKRL
jgi:cytochrome P450